VQACWCNKSRAKLLPRRALNVSQVSTHKTQVDPSVVDALLENFSALLVAPLWIRVVNAHQASIQASQLLSASWPVSFV